MAIFNKDNHPVAAGGQLSGLLGENCSFEGMIVFAGILRIDGRLTGKIICRPNAKGILIIGESGHVDADLLVVDNLMVAGKLFGAGPVIAMDKADFHQQSRIEIQKQHALYASRVIIRNKALFQGKIGNDSARIN